MNVLIGLRKSGCMFPGGTSIRSILQAGKTMKSIYYFSPEHKKCIDRKIN